MSNNSESASTAVHTVSIPARGTGSLLLVVSPHVCQFPGSILFDRARSFVNSTSHNRRVFQDLLALVQQQGTRRRLFLVGHTDSTGGHKLNQQLSERRAKSVLAILQGDVAVWQDLYRTEGWSTPELEKMVVETGEARPDDSAAVSNAARRYLGRANRQARADLFRHYFARLVDPAIAATIQYAVPAPPWIGCGEERLLRGTPSNPSRDPSLPEITGDFGPNRRTEFFFIENGTSVSVDCAQYPSWTATCALVTPSPPTLQWFVSAASGQDSTDPGRGTSRTQPFRTIRYALNHIAATSTATTNEIIVLTGTYREDVQLQSNVALRADQGVTPTLERGSPGNPVITCRNVQSVHVDGLIIDGRNQIGHGILIEDSCQDVEIVSCTVQNSRVDTQGGGIRIHGSREITVRGCHVTSNYALRGGGIAVLNSTQVTVGDGNTVDRNEAGTISTAVTHIALSASWHLTSIATFEITVGDAHGGGIYVENSRQVFIRHNQITENRAILFGGGIAVDNRAGFNGGLEISDNEITCNQVAHGDLMSLHASMANCSGSDMGDPVRTRMQAETIDAIAARAVSLLHGVGIESGLGGGIALRHVTSQTRLVGNRIGVQRLPNGSSQSAPNRARRGGGIECFTGAYPYFERNAVAFNLVSDDGGGIAVDHFDPFLPRAQPNFLGFSRGPYVPRHPIRMVNNRIRFNRSIEDGGGIYATGNARVEISGNATVIEGNRAGENGGGIRISYGTRLSIDGGRIVENRSNTIQTGGDREGGGGLAARNAMFDIRNCTFEGNEANQFAGGCVYCNSAWEGGFSESGFISNQRGQFDQIMEQDYGFHTRRYVLTDCTATGNRATGPSGAGGFLYGVRVPGNSGGTERMFVFIQGAGTAIGRNESHHSGAKRGNVVLDLSGNLVNGFPGIPQDLVFIMASSIQPSPPTPSGPVLVFNPRGMTGPDRPTTWPYSNAPAPGVTSVTPSDGPVTGGTAITIRGSGFDPASRVLLGSRSAVNISVRSPALIEADSPPGSLGSVDVVVQIPDGRTATMRGAFAYNPLPRITHIHPSVGPVGAATRITIHGLNFQPGAMVGIGGQSVPIISVTATQIVAETLPITMPGPAHVEVLNPDGGTHAIAGGFTFQ